MTDPKRSARISAWMALGSLAAIAGVMIVDTTVLRFGILVEDTRPYTTSAFLVRAVVLALAAVLFFTALARLHRPEDCPLAVVEREWYEPLLQWLALAATVASSEIFWVDSHLFYQFAREDHLVENASALFLFGTAACFLWLAFHLWRGKPRERLPMLCGVVGVAVAFFFLGMEEVS